MKPRWLDRLIDRVVYWAARTVLKANRVLPPRGTVVVTMTVEAHDKTLKTIQYKLGRRDKSWDEK